MKATHWVLYCHAFPVVALFSDPNQFTSKASWYFCHRKGLLHAMLNANVLAGSEIASLDRRQVMAGSRGKCDRCCRG